MSSGHAVRLIHTVYGQGYVLRAPEPEEDGPIG
jgi:DNA-binding response OmpR family regulator